MNNIETAIQFVKRQLKEQLGIDISFREGYGVDYFPHFLKGMDEIQYNKKIEMFLWLYNMVFRKNGLSSLAIIHYLLFYACLNSEKYDKANKHFQALEKELTKVKPDGEMADNLVNQISFIMLHEIYHVIFYDKPDIKDKILKFRMLSRYKKIKEDSRFPAAEDKRQYPFCDDSAAKLLSSFSFYLHLSPSIYKASGTCES